jgi:hypothetical protein
MRGINHHDDWSWSNAPRKGSNTSTTVQNNQPPQQFLDAYSNVMQQAQKVAGQPLQQYPGTPQSLIAGFSPDQTAAFQEIEGAQNIAQPYLNTAAQYMSAAGQPFQTPQFTNYLTQAAGPNVSNMANTGASGITGAVQSGQGMLSNAAQQGTSGILGASTAFQPGQIGQWLSPYTQNVVDTTQAQFNNQNQQQMNQLQGNAASQGALGSDRLGVAQGILANQQQLAQAPQIANLYQQGYTNAEQQALAQAQMGLTGATAAGQLGAGMAQAGAQLGLQGAQGAGAMGLQGATTQAQLESQAAQQILGANEAQGWLNSGLGYGMANLGQEALNTSLTGAGALMGVGGQQQQMAQQYLNIPYEQWVAQQSYPFQSTGWLANIAEGLGSQAGGTGTGTTTSPGPSAVSQIAGLGLTGAGIYGLGKQAGWWGGDPAAAAGTAGGFNNGADLISPVTGEVTVPPIPPVEGGARGGRITGFADGGGIDTTLPIVPGIGSVGMGRDPTAGMQTINLPSGTGASPDVSVSIIPQGASPAHGGMNILKNYGSTQTSTGSGGSNVIGDLGALASIARLGIALAANKGGRVPHFAAGGTSSGNWLPAGVTAAQANAATTPQVKPYVTQDMVNAWIAGGPSTQAPAGTPSPQPTGAGSTNGVTGGPGVPSVTVQPASYAGGIGVPMLSAKPIGTGSGSTGGSAASGSFSDYLNGVLGQIPTSAQLAATKPQAAPAPSAATSPSFSGNASLSPQQQAWAATLPFSDALATLGGVPTMSQTFAGQPLPTFGGGFGGGGGGEAGPVGGPAGNQAAAGVGTSNVGGVGNNAAAAAAGADTSDISDRSRGGALGRGFDDGGNVGLPLPDESTAGRAPPLGGSVSLPDPTFNSTVDAINASLNAPTAAPRATMRERRITPSPLSNVGITTRDTEPGTTTPSQPPARSTPGFQDAIKALDDLQAPGHTVSPWMYLLQAGLGTMAGKSPFAGVNIGAGALGAVKSWESEDKDARDLSTRVAEAKARIAESQAYQQSMIDTRNRGVDVQQQKAQDAINIALIHAANRAGGRGGSDRETVVPGMLSDQGTILTVGRDGKIYDSGVKAGPSANTSSNINDKEQARQQAAAMATARADAATRRGDTAEFNRNLRTVYNAHPDISSDDARAQARALSAPASAAPANDPLGIR